jgi:hypothetical protein
MLGLRPEGTGGKLMGKVLIVAGLVAVLVGLVMQFAPQAFSWLGKLPGDIRYEKGNMKFFFPITTMILVSVGISLLLKFLGR